VWNRIKKRESSKYKLRWEIEGIFSIIKEILGMKHIWYVMNRDYDSAIEEIIVACNCIVMADKNFRSIRYEDHVYRELTYVWTPLII
jgi:hypothetical protein